MNGSVFHVYVNTYIEKVFKKPFLFFLFFLLLSKSPTEIFLYVEQGTESEVFDDNLRFQLFELNKASRCLSKIIYKDRRLFMFRVFSD